jgi:hypothetical protein
MKKLIAILFLAISFASSYAQVFWSNDFSNASNWVFENAPGTNSQTWQIGTVGPTGAYAIDPIQSTTAANGFALFDSDLHCGGNQIANLTTANSIDCSSQSRVVLEFQQQYRRFYDSTFVFVSINNGLSWTKFPVNENLENNNSSFGNAEIVRVNLSNIAGNQPNVLLRFQFYSPSSINALAGCAYSWMIDDVKLTNASNGFISTSFFANQNVNIDPEPITFQLLPTGCSSYTYQWYSIDGLAVPNPNTGISGWNLISNATSSTYDPPLISASTSYACYVTPNSGCGAQGWALGASLYEVYLQLGIIGYSSSQLGVGSIDPVAITFTFPPSGCSNGFAYQWYSSNGLTTLPNNIDILPEWTPIAGATQETYDPGQLTQSTTIACYVSGCGLTGWASGEIQFEVTEPPSQTLPEKVIGQTYYDLQTNGSMPTRIINHGDGTLSAAWTFSGELGSPWSDRGMAYHFFDGTNWVSNPPYQDANNINRIESVRTGFGSIGRVAGVGDIIVAHQTAISALQVSRNPFTNSTQNWISTAETSMPLVWPRIAVGGPDGRTVHAIALTEPTGGTFTGAPFNGINGAMLYNRSTDGGITWGTTMVALPGIDSTIFSSMSGDNYAIDAKGNTVAIVAGESNSRVMLWKSTNNGLTWDTTQIMSFPYEPWDDSQITDLDGDGDVDSFLVNGVYQTESIPCSDGSYSILIDNQNQVHVWFGAMRMSNDVTGDGSFSYYPGTSGIYYWKESFGLDGMTIIADLVDDDGDGAFTVFANYTSVGTTVGPTPYAAGLTTFPSAGIDAAGNLYMIYSGAKEGLQYALDGFYPSFKHIYAVKSTDGGATWSLPTDLVGDESAGFDQFSEYAYCSMAKKVDENIHLIYQRDFFPGSAVTISDAAYHPFDLPNDIVYLKVSKTLEAFTLGSIAGSGILNGNPNPISIAIQPSGCSSFTYQWYSFNGVETAPSGSSTSGWTLIPGATSTSYDPPALSQSTTFACFVTALAGCGTSGWAQGAASFTITASAGQVNSTLVQQCEIAPVELNFTAAPSGLGSVAYQWYYQNGEVGCPQGSSTFGWQIVSGANSATGSFTPPSEGTYTLACFVNSETGVGLWASGCKVVTQSSFEAQTIIGSTDVVPFTQTPYLVSQITGHTYQWTATGGAIASGQGTNFVNVVWSNTGPYSLQLVESDGVCSDISVLDLGVVTDLLSGGLQEGDVWVYPNPASDYLFVYSSESLKEDYTVLDLSGRIVKRGKLVGNFIDFSESGGSFEQGIYLLELLAPKRLVVPVILGFEN